ncbi:Uncharacterized protein TCM_042455 [Theobroma cacao]|uniref:Uncharacterized protein n=1 Tax=Theobroma cacao TaxID=3641 RepID=A0A061FKX4_THECC|nr:Uncharacterized protein TCM_042455 [Theobroma cacao]
MLSTPYMATWKFIVLVLLDSINYLTFVQVRCYYTTKLVGKHIHWALLSNLSPFVNRASKDFRERSR